MLLAALCLEPATRRRSPKQIGAGGLAELKRVVTEAVNAVDRFKWLEPRHMVNISDRWNRDKNDDLQFAFFNGVGWESWENIWGIWNGITPRDAEATRRMATIERGFAPFLSKRWVGAVLPDDFLWRFREPVAT